MARFIDSNRNEPDKKLCLGYPFLVVNQAEIAPLIYVPVEITESYDSFVLRSEGFEVSYAALRSLRMTEEEINAFIDECDQVEPASQETIIQALERLLFAKITEIYREQLPRRHDQFQPGTIYDGPALFWVSSNIATVNLIRELRELAEPSRWEKVPVSLKQLLTVLPDHDYPSLQSWDQDTGIFVTPVNPQQLRVIQSVRSEPVVVVTGPPGTGKSQLVLNLIAEAFLKGEKVLFASRNNGAVDVVMNRLLNELQFQGAIRTGNNMNREKAAMQMRAALNRAGTKGSQSNLKSPQDLYMTARQNALQAQDQLDQVRKLSGLLVSHQQERGKYLEYLPKGLRKIAEETVPTYQAAEAEDLQATLSSLLEQALGIKDEKLHLEKGLNRIEKEGGTDYPLVAEIHRVEDQWGAFGGGFIRSSGFATMESLVSHVKIWLVLIETVEMKAQSILLSGKLNHLNMELSEKRSAIPREMAGKDELVARNFSNEEIEGFVNLSRRLEDRFKKFSSGTISIWERLLNWATRGALLKKEIRSFEWLHQQLDLPVASLQDAGAEGCAVLAGELNLLLDSARLLKDLAVIRSELDALSQAILNSEATLPSAVSDDINKLRGYDFDNSRLRADLQDLLKQIEDLQTKSNQLTGRINNQLDKNENRSSMLNELKKSLAGKDNRLWKLNTPAAPEAIIQHLTKWHNLVSFWGMDASSKHIESLLASLPGEKEALLNLKKSQDRMLQLSGEIMRVAWLERARKMSNEVLQDVHNYVAAVEELTRNYNPETYQHFKAVEKAKLEAAVQVFPIWAITNLTAKTNFPLINEFFDLVIIDEASQCDFPSALPLLYRARKVVIIGDPNQLRHVATLSKEADQELAARYGVGFDAFSYNTHSLYDIAQSSSGSRPGALLLNEHYRSDARIISFSNEEFYNGELVIKTDLTQRNVRRTFLNQFGGMFWLEVDGRTEYPRGGSLSNPDELASIQKLLPRFMEALDKHELGDASIGIVTPYRAQQDQIQNWVNDQYGGTDRITVGTAHKFQGDEKDFMIFSPVVARGISEGSLGWLQRTRNLLNVAVTRARISLIIIGDWKYCQSLKEDHCFRRLADYVARQPERILKDIEALPLLGKPSVDIVGYVTNPHNPEHNRTTLRRFVSSCSEFVWWADPYFNNHVFDLWWDVFQDPEATIREVRLLTAKELTVPQDDRRPQLSPERFEAIRSDLATRGIRLEMRLLDRRDLPHDRLFYSPGQAINMPPFAGAYGDHRHVSEYTRSGTSRDLFIQYWKKADDC